jgi:hypothetical protein
MILLFMIVGLAAATFLPHALPRYFAGRLAAIFLLGVGAHGAVLFALGVAGVPLRAPTFAAVTVISLAIAALRAKRIFLRTRWRGDMHEMASTAMILLPFLVLLWTTSVVPLADYDGRTTWMPKARAIAGEGSIRGPFFQGERGLNLHNHYPLLIPLDVATLLALGASPRPLFVLIPAAMLLAARDLLSRRFGTAAAGWCMAALAWLPQIVIAPEGGATSAYSDLAVAAFFGMAVVTRPRVAASLWIAFLILTKNEGLLLALAALAWRPRVRMLIAPAIALALLLGWQQLVPDAYDERNAALLLELPSRLAFLDDAALAIGRHALDLRTWGVLWPLVALCAFGRRVRSEARVLMIAMAGYVAVMACTSWSITQLANVTAHRLLLHCIVPAGCIVMACMSSSGGSRPPIVRPSNGTTVPAGRGSGSSAAAVTSSAPIS